MQVEQTANPKDTSAKTPGKLPSHASMEEYLERYCGLMLFVKEIDYTRYQQICAVRPALPKASLPQADFDMIAGVLYGDQRSAPDRDSGPHEHPQVSDPQGHRGRARSECVAAVVSPAWTIAHEAFLLPTGFSGPKESPTIRQQSMRRVGTVVRSPHESGRSKDQSGKITGGEAFKQALLQVTPRITREQGFISDFLAINPLDASITFADYMQLETYFRRGATTYLASQQGKLKDIKSAMDLVFGFLEAEVRDWAETIVRTDNMCAPLSLAVGECAPLTPLNTLQPNCRNPRRDGPCDSHCAEGAQRVPPARVPEAVPEVGRCSRTVLRASRPTNSYREGREC